MMSSTSDNEYGRGGAVDREAEADSRPDDTELEETTCFAAADSDWSAKVLREATNLLMAGKSREVARLCHQVIEHDPQNLAGYELLGMAEEENGNLHLALQAYEQVVALDPERKADKEKVLALRERLAEEPAEPEDEQDRRLKLLNRWATVALVASLLLLMGVAIAVFALRAHNTRLAQASHDQAFDVCVARGKQLMAAERYDEAMAAFREADQTKSGDAGVRKLWDEAYREYCAAVIRDYRSLGGKLSLEPRQNPFAPVPVGPQEGGTSDSSATGYRPGRSVPLPPDTRVANLPPALFYGPEGPPEFLEYDVPEFVPSGTGPPTDSSPSGQSSLPAQPYDQQPTGQISISVGQSPGSSAARQSAEALRREADGLRREGSYQEAITRYQTAEQRYNQEIEQDPSAKAVGETAIKSIRQSIKVCEEKIGR